MIYLLFILLFIKHTIVDFCWQTDAEIANKGTYGDIRGVLHSYKHAVGTYYVSLFFLASIHIWWYFWGSLILISLLDGVIHYHVDYIKKRFGNPDPSKKQHWRHFGYDQLAHLLTYVLIVYLVMLWR